jgi:hypothetical protein
LLLAGYMKPLPKDMQDAFAPFGEDVQ